MTPRIPYLELPELPLIPARLFGDFPAETVTLKPFGTLVALGVYVGATLAVREGRRRGYPERELMAFVTWVAAGGFIGGHMLDAIFYYPRDVLADPLSLLRLWEGLSSFGGFCGALLGGLAYRTHRRVGILPFTEVLSSSFPAAWVFGRLGCTFAHDHPGIVSDAWFAVAYPEGGRLDLGLLELLITLPLAAYFLWCRKRGPRPLGFYTGVMCTYYAPLRFLLDFLRAGVDEAAGPFGIAGDARYSNLTPAQWACVPLLGLGLFMLRRAQLGPPAPVVAADSASHAELEGAGSEPSS
jgi:phosphatidylglycerol:prolipoprotein diacylglycerol transferase